jgi:hypothetical protein
MGFFELRRDCVVNRPSEVVRAHFLDFDHHIEHGVHAGVHYTVLDRLGEGARQRVRSAFKVLGMNKVDEVIAYLDGSGDVVQEFVKGDFVGGTIRVHFVPRADGATHLIVQLRVPLRGMNRLLAPIVKSTVVKLTQQALEEDRRDLEGGYQPKAALLDALGPVRRAA